MWKVKRERLTEWWQCRKKINRPEIIFFLPLFLFPKGHLYQESLQSESARKFQEEQVAAKNKSLDHAPLLWFLVATWHTILLVQFSSVASHVWHSSTSWAVARQAYLSNTNSWSPPKLMSIESMMSSNHLIPCHLLLLLPSIFPSIRISSFLFFHLFLLVGG